MALIKLKFKPGVNRDQTNYTGEGGWYDMDKVRFYSEYPQKIGGWLRYTFDLAIGISRQVFNWITSYQDNLLSIGTSKKLYLEAGGNLFDITPIRATFSTPDTDDCLATTDESKEILITLIGHNADEGDYITISGATSVGGIPDTDINKEFSIFDVTSTTFKILVDTEATSTTTGGGNLITIDFQISVGLNENTEGYGWGTDGWGRGEWGSGSSVPIYLESRDWFYDNFDNDLVCNIRDGAIYYWARGTNPNPNFTSRAVLLSSLFGASDVPDVAMQVLISQNDKHLLALACTPFGGGNADPLLIRWADQDTPENWTPSSTNSAGFLRLSRGSKIVRGLPTRQEILIWTDSNLYSLKFLGTTDVFGVEEYADNISIASPRAVTTASNVTYWMGLDKFYAYTGRVETLPCTIRNYVFGDINYNRMYNIVSGTNEAFNEVWWFYPSEDSVRNNRYVIYNHVERVWYYGNIERTAWNDSPLRQHPQAIYFDSETGLSTIYDHERGVNDDTSPMESFIRSNDFDLEDGDKFILTKRIITDIGFNGSVRFENASPKVTMEIMPRNFPGSAYHGSSDDAKNVISTTVDEFTNQVFIRARARQMALKVSSNEIGVNWQFGSPRLDGREDGKR
jgi:hypothetical protein